MALTFTHQGINFRAEKIDAEKQFHVVRRLGPVLAEVANALRSVASIEGAEKVDTNAAALAGFAGIAGALAKLSDDEAGYVLHNLLVHVTREQPGAGWHPLSNGKSMMFSDIELPTMMFCAFNALRFNCANFLPAVPSSLMAAILKRNAP